MAAVKTVRVAAPVVDGNPHGYIVINEDDLRDDHELWEEKPAPREDVKPGKKTSKD